ncbi:hypothetical protein [Aeromonas veronii]|uniref:phage nozzle protein n=1 Tax=Aeromonas veronii TaxID=654 RepID=UPI003B9F28D0
MGRLISQKIANMIQGVSQQAPELRRPEQCEEQINCWNSFITGMQKRPCGVFKAKYTVPQGFIDDEFTVWSYVDYGLGFGRVVVAIDKDGTVIAFKEDGTPITVEGDTQYLRLGKGNPNEKKFAILPYGSAAFLLNRAAPAMPMPDALIDKNTLPLPFTKGSESFYLVMNYPEKNSDYNVNVAGEVITAPRATDPAEVANTVFQKLVAKYPSYTWRLVDSVITGEKPEQGDPVAFADGTHCATFTNYTVPKTDSTVESVIGYAHVKQGDYGTTYKVCIKHGDTTTVAAVTTPDGSEAGQRPQISLNVIRDNLIKEIQKDTTIVCSPVGTTGLEIRAKNDGTYSVWGEDSLNNMAIKAFDYSVPSEADLPNECIDGYTVRVSAKNSDDAFYLRFSGSDKKDASKWMETPKPLEPYKLWAATMPHLLVPTKKTDGSYVITIKRPEWDARNTGDLDSTPFPQVVSSTSAKDFTIKYIKTMSLYQSRLVIAGGPYLSMSRTNMFFNLFPPSMLAEEATDPINLLMTGQEGELVNAAHVIPTEHDVLVMCDTHQVEIGSDSGVMSPSSVYAKAKTSYTMNSEAMPALVGDSIYFMDTRDGYSSCQQYSVRDTVGGRYAIEINSHCATYIDKPISMLYGTPKGILVLKPSGLTNEVFVYQFLDNGENRVQSAWHKWLLNREVLAMEFREGNLYCLIRYDGYVENQAFLLEKDGESERLGIPIKLDSRKEWGDTKPTDLREGEIAIRRRGVWFSGFPYKQKYTFSTFYFWNQSTRAAVTSGRLQLRRIKLLYRDSTSFDVYINREGDGRSSVRKFRGRVLGSMNNILGKVPAESGQFTVPLLSHNTNVVISIENDSPHDARFLSAEWEGFYNTRTLQW